MNDDDQPVVAIGVGCRIGCSATAIHDLVLSALETWPQRPVRATNTMFTIADKRDENGLRRAAEELGYELRFLSREALRKVSPRVRTRSAVSLARFGVQSVAEASALAGIGSEGVLVVPRMSNAGATCAIASVLTPLQRLTGEAFIGAERSR